MGIIWATEHTKERHGQFDLLHPKTVRILPYMHERKIREALEIKKLRRINEKEKTFTVLNRGNGDYVTANFWKPVLENGKPLNCTLGRKHYDVNLCNLSV